MGYDWRLAADHCPTPDVDSTTFHELLETYQNCQSMNRLEHTHSFRGTKVCQPYEHSMLEVGAAPLSTPSLTKPAGHACMRTS